VVPVARGEIKGLDAAKDGRRDLTLQLNHDLLVLAIRQSLRLHVALEVIG